MNLCDCAAGMVLFTFLTFWMWVTVLPTNAAGVSTSTPGKSNAVSVLCVGLLCRLLCLTEGSRLIVLWTTLSTQQWIKVALCAQGKYVKELTDSPPKVIPFAYWLSPPPPPLRAGQPEPPPAPEVKVAGCHCKPVFLHIAVDTARQSQSFYSPHSPPPLPRMQAA